MARPYSLAGGRFHFERLDSTIVRLDTDAGLARRLSGYPRAAEPAG